MLGLPALLALRHTFPTADLRVIGPVPQVQLAAWCGAANTVAGISDRALAPLFAGRDQPWPPILDRLDAAVLWLRQPDELAPLFRGRGVFQVLAAPPFPPVAPAAGGEHSEAQHVAEWLAGTLAPLGVRLAPDWDAVPWLTLPPATGETGMAGLGSESGSVEAGTGTAVGGSEPLIESGRPYVVLHAGSGSKRKNWAVDSWMQVATAIARDRDLRLIVVTGPVEVESGADSPAPLGTAHGVSPIVVQNPDLLALSHLLAGAALYLGNDSGVTHLAAAVGAPVVAVFGPTDPAIWRPRGPRVTVLGGAPTSPDGALFASEAHWPIQETVYEAAQRRVQSTPQ